MIEMGCSEGCLYKGSTGVHVRGNFSDDLLEKIIPYNNKLRSLLNLKTIADHLYRFNALTLPGLPEPKIVVVYAGPDKVDKITIANLMQDRLEKNQLMHISGGQFFPRLPSCSEQSQHLSKDKQIIYAQKKELIWQCCQIIAKNNILNFEHVFEKSRGLYIITGFDFRVTCCPVSFEIKTNAEELLAAINVRI